MTAPVKIGNLIAGTFNDATGHSGQSHLVYAPNAGRVVAVHAVVRARCHLTTARFRAYVSSGPDLGERHVDGRGGQPHALKIEWRDESLLAGGRSLGVAIRSIGGVDYAHVFASVGLRRPDLIERPHPRATRNDVDHVGGPWHNPGSPNTASE